MKARRRTMMTAAEKEIKRIESLSGRSSVDNQVSLTLALCQCARQLARIGDQLARLERLYQFDPGRRPDES